MHKCVRCLTAVQLSEFLANDHICTTCSEQVEDFPYASDSHFETYSPVDRLREPESPIVEDLTGAP